MMQLNAWLVWNYIKEVAFAGLTSMEQEEPEAAETIEISLSLTYMILYHGIEK